MKTYTTYLVAAALALSSSAISAENKVKNAPDQSQNAGEKLQQIGNQLADETTATEARTMLAKLVNEGVTEGHFQNLVGYLSKADRDRIGDFKHAKMEDLDKAIAQFRIDFKAKYNQDFEMRPEHFRDAIVYAGRDKSSATVSLPDLEFDRPSDALKNAAKPPKANLDKAITDAKAKTEAKPDKTRAALTLNLINEGKVMSAWRLDIPNEITADQLKANLIKHIQTLSDQKATWPVEADAAYHAAALQVLQALHDSTLASDK